MATICKRESKNGQIRYQAKIRIKGQSPVSETFERKSDAVKWARNTEKEIEDGIYFKTLEARKHTLAELIDRYIENVIPHKYSKKADQEKVKTHLNWWKDKLGNRFLIDITPILLAEYRDKLLKEPYKKFKRISSKIKSEKQEETKEVERFRSGSTANRYMAALSTALTTATNEWGWLDENTMLKVKKKPESRGRVRFLSNEEHHALLNACKKVSNPNLYVVVQIALATGARFSEIMHLKWGNIDFERKVLYFLDTKNKESRSVPLTGEAYNILLEYSKIRKINTKYAFPNRKGDKPIELKRQWENAIKEARLIDFHFHDLRHTAASYLAMNGASLIDIAHILGHKTLQMTKRYSHLTDQHTVSVLEKMNENRSRTAKETVHQTIN